MGTKVALASNSSVLRTRWHVWATATIETSVTPLLCKKRGRAVAEQIRIKLNPATVPFQPLPLDPQAKRSLSARTVFWEQFTVVGYGRRSPISSKPLIDKPISRKRIRDWRTQYYFWSLRMPMSPQDGESKAQDAAHQAVAWAKVWLNHTMPWAVSC